MPAMPDLDPAMICDERHRKEHTTFYPSSLQNEYMAGWQSGYAADCKSVYAGSIPTPASISYQNILVTKM